MFTMDLWGVEEGGRRREEGGGRREEGTVKLLPFQHTESADTLIIEKLKTNIGALQTPLEGHC